MEFDEASTADPFCTHHEKIDKEISDYVQGGYDQAMQILEKNKEKLEAVTKILLLKEALEREEFEKIVGKKNKD